MIKKLYHGTKYYFQEPDLNKSRYYKDFGRGFYLTTNEKQAGKWAVRNLAHNDRTHVAYIYEYDFQADSLEDLKILKLLECNKEWLDFVAYQRTHFEETIEYDLIFDKMADGQGGELAEVLEDYSRGKCSFEKAFAIAKSRGSYRDQYCFKTLRALQKIKRQRYAEVYNLNGSPKILKWHNVKEKTNG